MRLSAGSTHPTGMHSCYNLFLDGFMVPTDKIRCTPSSSSTHTCKGHTQMDISFVHVPRLCSTSFTMYCATQVEYKNGISVHISTFRLRKYRRSDVSPVDQGHELVRPKETTMVSLFYI